ncbi:unnamed protein product, partial [Amoebophrya sp. A120]
SPHDTNRRSHRKLRKGAQRGATPRRVARSAQTRHQDLDENACRCTRQRCRGKSH